MEPLKAPANDSVARVVEFLGDRWTFLILRESFFGVRRFGEFARRLEVSRTLLSGRLRRLVDQGVLERRQYQAEPEFFEYGLTEAGLALYPAILALMHWGDTYLAGPEGPPLVLRHRTCGHQASPRLVCAACGDGLDVRDMDFELGPGAEGDAGSTERSSTSRT